MMMICGNIIFPHSPHAFQYMWPTGEQAFLFPEKKVLAEWPPMHASSPSLVTGKMMGS